MEKKISYPQYRKYHNGKNYFRISSPSELEEIQFMGSKCFINKLEAKILPDRNFIHDLTFDFSENAAEIPEKEYLDARERCLAGRN
ncbi:MAG TPA: hypothetical protein VI112_11970 [Bacteroidia bacterium]